MVCHHPCIRICAPVLHLNFLFPLCTMKFLYSCCCRRLEVFVVNGQRREEARAISKQRKQNLSWVGFCLGLEFVHYMTTARSHHVTFLFSCWIHQIITRLGSHFGYCATSPGCPGIVEQIVGHLPSLRRLLITLVCPTLYFYLQIQSSIGNEFG